MGKKIYVGNIPYTTTEDEVREMFTKFGEILSIKMVTDYHTGRFKGFGFIEMEAGDAKKAIDALDGKDYNGRSLRVKEARDREDRPSNRKSY